MKKTGMTLDESTGDLAIRVKRDSYGKIAEGLVVDNVEKQNQALIIHLHPGELKEYLTVGVGISDMLMGKDALLFKHRIREQLESDGFSVSHLDIKQNNEGQTNIELDAKY